MQRRSFLKRSLAGTALLSTLGAASARRTATESTASVGFFVWGRGTGADVDHRTTATVDGTTVTVDGVVAGWTDGRVDLTDWSAALDEDGILYLTVRYEKGGPGRRHRTRGGAGTSLADYRAEVEASTAPDEVVVIHESASGDRWNSAFGPDQFDVRITDTAVGTGDDATILIDGDRLSVDGTLTVDASCERPVLDDAAVRNGRLRLSVVSASPPSGTVCTPYSQVHYRLTGPLPVDPDAVVVEHDGDVIATSA